MVEAFVDFLNYTAEHQPGQWSGYPYFGSDYKGHHYIAPYLVFFGEEADAAEAINFFEALPSTNPYIAKGSELRENYDSWLGMHGSDTDPVGGSGFLVSRLIQAENIATPEARAELVDAFVAGGNATPFNFVGGKGVMDKDPDSTETSVTPAWRKTIGHLTFGAAVPEEITEQSWHDAAVAASDLANPIRAITPNSGAYINESDYYEPNWEHSFWGEANYARLKTIKQKYDPTGMFRVWNGVGGTRPETSSSVTE